MLDLDCIPCFVRQAVEASRRATPDRALQDSVLRDVLRMVADLADIRSSPAVGQAVHRRVRLASAQGDPYADVKVLANRVALAMLPELGERVRAADDPLLAAAKCAVAANAIDMGILSSVAEHEVEAALRGAFDLPVHGDWARLRDAARGAMDILYLADNTGEIVVDRLAIEQLGPHRVTVAVRGGPILNDATRADADAVGISALSPVIDNGSDAPGTLLSDCSPAFVEHFHRADLVIAKGQGNFESLWDAPRPVAFWFKVKCAVVGRSVGLPVGTLMLLSPGEASFRPGH